MSDRLQFSAAPIGKFSDFVVDLILLNGKGAEPSWRSVVCPWGLELTAGRQNDAIGPLTTIGIDEETV